MINIPLYSGDNKTVYSSIFDVAPGYAVVLFATGLATEKVRASAEEISGPQVFCVRRIIQGFTPQVREKCLRCLCVYDTWKMPEPITLVDQLVITCAGGWQLSACRNIGIIGVPGTYRLELNDVTAVGTANAYVNVLSLDKIAPIDRLFFS